MAYVPGLDHDLFLSYSHEDARWVSALQEELADRLLRRDPAKDAQGKATWGEPKLSAALALRRDEVWNEHWAHQYSPGRFEDVDRFLERSSAAVRKQKFIRWFGIAAAAAVVILTVMAYRLRHQNSLEHQQNTALKELSDSAAKELEKRKQNEMEQEGRIASLNAMQGSTKEERDRIQREKSDAEARLRQYQEETKKQQATQAQQSTDLVASVKSLQDRLDAAQRDRDAECQKRREAETKAAQLEALLQKERESGAQSPPPRQAQWAATEVTFAVLAEPIPSRRRSSWIGPL